MREGKRHDRFGHLGVYIHSLGPNSPVPGDRLKIVIYDAQDRIVRRFEQIRGTCIDPGFVSFFEGPHNRPGRYLMPLVDIAPDGKMTELVHDVTGSQQERQEQFRSTLGCWAETHGIPEENSNGA